MFCGLALLAGLILKFGDFSYWFREKYPLRAIFMDAGNLVSGAPVRRGGVEIGRVTEDPSLSAGMAGVRVPLVIYSEYLVDKHSDFQIKTDGIIGDTFIEVTPPTMPSGAMLDKGAEITGKGGAGFNDLSNAANKVAEKTVIVLEDIRGSLAELKVAINKIQTGVLSDKNLDNFSGSLADLKASLAKIDLEVLSDDNVKKLGTAVSKIAETSEKLVGAVDKASHAFTVADEAVTKSFGGALEEIKLAATSLRKTADALGVTATDIRNGPGLMGGLIKDPKIRSDMAAFVSNLRRHGIWRYKDDAAEEGQPKQSRGFRLFGN